MRRAWIACVAALAASACARVAQGQQQLAQQAQIKDAVSTYERGRTSGDALRICVDAGMVANAYADAHDLPNQQAWAARRREDCGRAYTALTPGSDAKAPDRLDAQPRLDHTGAR
jgi:hypothetical protein